MTIFHTWFIIDNVGNSIFYKFTKNLRYESDYRCVDFEPKRKFIIECQWPNNVTRNQTSTMYNANNDMHTKMHFLFYVSHSIFSFITTTVLSYNTIKNIIYLLVVVTNLWKMIFLSLLYYNNVNSRLNRLNNMVVITLLNSRCQ